MGACIAVLLLLMCWLAPSSAFPPPLQPRALLNPPSVFLNNARPPCLGSTPGYRRLHLPPLRSGPAPAPRPSPRSALIVLSRRAFTFVFCPALALAAALEGYSRLTASPLRQLSDNAAVRWLGGLRSPTSNSLAPLPRPAPGTKTMTMVFHGAGGPDSYTSELMSKVEEEASKNGGYCHFVDWSEYSTNLFKAAFNGQAVGKHAARSLRELLGEGEEPNVHLVGISVGAFAADAACSEYRALWSSTSTSSTSSESTGYPRPTLQLTLLDPFTQRGVLGPGYGSRNFGKSADYAQQFMNTDDPVPSTNEPCGGCAVWDVTGARERGEGGNGDIFGHDWPLVYFSRYWKGGVGMVPEGERKGKGAVTKLE